MNEKAAILHYQHKRRTLPSGEKGRVLLIDAGHRSNGYCSDITRTSLAEGGDRVFLALLGGVERIKQRLISQVRPGLAYLDIHRAAMRQITELAIELELVTASLEEALRLNLSGLFMPHGVGHLLGIQVHDVGGHQQDDSGSLQAPPPEYPFLRNTRILESGMVFTIEPGFYLIPLLLEPVRHTRTGRHLNWPLIDRLLPCGGIRVEDNVLVTADGVENLTRQ